MDGGNGGGWKINFERAVGESDRYFLGVDSLGLFEGVVALGFGSGEDLGRTHFEVIRDSANGDGAALIRIEAGNGDRIGTVDARRGCGEGGEVGAFAEIRVRF